MTKQGKETGFTENEFFENLLKRKADDPQDYERTFSSALRITVDFYEAAKRRHEHKEQSEMSEVKAIEKK